MGYLYSKMSPFYNTRTISISTAGTNMFPTSTGVVYDNNAFDNLPGDEKHYLISGKLSGLEKRIFLVFVNFAPRFAACPKP